MSCRQGAVTALLVVLVVGVQGHQIIYVDTENGILNSSCWEGGLDQPCGSLELADTGARRYNSTVAVVLRHGISCTTAPTSLQILSYQSLPTKDNGTCECNELDNDHKYNLASAKSSFGSCPPWFEQFNGTCRCGETIDGIVKCNELLQESSILGCYCMTYNETAERVVVGACFYNCIFDLDNVLYLPMPKTVGQLNDVMCGDFNRDGQLCGECKTNYSPPVYSYNLQCTMCSDDQYNWMKYVAVAFVPLTVFLVFFLCCRISATSPKLYAFVLFSQFIASPANVRVVLAGINGSDYTHAAVVGHILFTIYGCWNLDFFRTLIPHAVCLKVDTLQALALDYGVAFYPLALIFVTYVLIELHAHNFRVIVWIWKPFHKCFARFRQQCDIKTSIIDAFATFLLLSNIKLLNVSFDLLTPTYVYNMNGSVVGIYLYYDASIEYFGTEKHLPYALLAVFVVVTFILFPILILLLYPMRCFQQCLGCCRVKWHALHIFIDAFQGCYKDGTNGTRDCRYFAALYFLMRPILFILFAVTYGVVFYALANFVFVGVAMVLAIVQPYKAEFAIYNAVDLVFFLAMALLCSTAMLYNIVTAKARYFLEISILIGCLVESLPLLYLVAIFLHWICSRKGIGQRLVKSIKGWVKRFCIKTHGRRLEESLPDRVVNFHLYHDAMTNNTENTEQCSDQAYSNIGKDSDLVK